MESFLSFMAPDEVLDAWTARESSAGHTPASTTALRANDCLCLQQNHGDHGGMGKNRHSFHEPVLVGKMTSGIALAWVASQPEVELLPTESMQEAYFAETGAAIPFADLLGTRRLLPAECGMIAA